MLFNCDCLQPRRHIFGHAKRFNGSSLPSEVSKSVRQMGVSYDIQFDECISFQLQSPNKHKNVKKKSHKNVFLNNWKCFITLKRLGKLMFENIFKKNVILKHCLNDNSKYCINIQKRKKKSHTNVFLNISNISFENVSCPNVLML